MTNLSPPHAPTATQWQALRTPENLSTIKSVQTLCEVDQTLFISDGPGGLWVHGPVLSRALDTPDGPRPDQRQIIASGAVPPRLKQPGVTEFIISGLISGLTLSVLGNQNGVAFGVILAGVNFLIAALIASSRLDYPETTRNSIFELSAKRKADLDEHVIMGYAILAIGTLASVLFAAPGWNGVGFVFLALAISGHLTRQHLKFFWNASRPLLAMHAPLPFITSQDLSQCDPKTLRAIHSYMTSDTRKYQLKALEKASREQGTPREQAGPKRAAVTPPATPLAAVPLAPATFIDDMRRPAQPLPSHQPTEQVHSIKVLPNRCESALLIENIEQLAAQVPAQATNKEAYRLRSAAKRVRDMTGQASQESTRVEIATLALKQARQDLALSLQQHDQPILEAARRYYREEDEQWPL